MHKQFLLIFILFLLNACDKRDAPPANNYAASGDSIKTLNATESKSKASNSLKDGVYCFSHHYNQDVTDVQLTILGSTVKGIMNWIPHQKDSARGTLQGFKNDAGELDLMYDYMIEGNQQTETKRMKIQNGKLFIKKGALLDENNNGNLVYKDVNQAEYSEVLEPAKCK